MLRNRPTPIESGNMGANARANIQHAGSCSCIQNCSSTAKRSRRNPRSRGLRSTIQTVRPISFDLRTREGWAFRSLLGASKFLGLALRIAGLVGVRGRLVLLNARLRVWRRRPLPHTVRMLIHFAARRFLVVYSRARRVPVSVRVLHERRTPSDTMEVNKYFWRKFS